MSEKQDPQFARLEIREKDGGLTCLLNGVDLAPLIMADGLSIKSDWRDSRAVIEATITLAVTELDADLLVKFQHTEEPVNG